MTRAMIGLSGLITPSLDEMVTVAEEMQRSGMGTPDKVWAFSFPNAACHTARFCNRLASPADGVQDVMAEADHTQLASARLIVPSAIDCAFRSECSKPRKAHSNRKTAGTAARTLHQLEVSMVKRLLLFASPVLVVVACTTTKTPTSPSTQGAAATALAHVGAL